MADEPTAAKCGHELRAGIVCGLVSGHWGEHRASVEELSPNYHMYEWNDAREERHDRELGEAIMCDYDLGAAERQKVMNLAVLAALKALPKGAVFEIRAKCPPPHGPGSKGDFGRRFIPRRESAKDWGIAWYHECAQPDGFEQPTMATKPLGFSLVDECPVDPMIGCVVAARLKVGAFDYEEYCRVQRARMEA